MEKSEEASRPGVWSGSFSPLSGSANNNKSQPSQATSLSQILQQNGNINLVSRAQPSPAQTQSLSPELTVLS